MKKLFRYIGSWAHWLAAKLVDAFFRIVTFAVLAIIMVLACMYVIDYAYQKNGSPCMYDRFEYSAVVKLRLYEPGMEKVKLTLVEFELRYEDRIRWFRAWLTPDQVKAVEEKTPINVMEMPSGGHIIQDWLVTIEEL